MPDDNKLEKWSDIIMNSGNKEKEENKQFFINNPPIAELTEIFADYESNIGVFEIDNQFYWAEKSKNGYRRSRLVRIPSSVVEFLKDYED